MQQMVACQADLGTYAGQSLVIGHDKGTRVALRPQFMEPARS
jgi:hypothetical protein